MDQNNPGIKILVIKGKKKKKTNKKQTKENCQLYFI